MHPISMADPPTQCSLYSTNSFPKKAKSSNPWSRQRTSSSSFVRLLHATKMPSLTCIQATTRSCTSRASNRRSQVILLHYSPAHRRRVRRVPQAQEKDEAVHRTASKADAGAGAVLPPHPLDLGSASFASDRSAAGATPPQPAQASDSARASELTVRTKPNLTSGKRSSGSRLVEVPST